MASHKVRSSDEWLTLIQKFAVSDVSIADFCRQVGISEGSFYRWRNLLTTGRLRPRPRPITDEIPASFLELGTLTPASTDNSRLDIRLELGDGIVLHLVRG